MPFMKYDVYTCPYCKSPLFIKELLLGDPEETAKTKFCNQCGKRIASDLAESLAKVKD